MEKSSFFNSVSHDRTYKAEDWAEYFASFIGNGVFEHSGEEHSEAPQRRVSLIHTHTEAQPETGHLLQCLCKADEH